MTASISHPLLSCASRILALAPCFRCLVGLGPFLAIHTLMVCGIQVGDFAPPLQTMIGIRQTHFSTSLLPEVCPLLPLASLAQNETVLVMDLGVQKASVVEQGARVVQQSSGHAFHIQSWPWQAL